MNSPAKEEVLTSIEAARLIFNTEEPTEEQVRRVEGEIKRGTLRRSRQGGMTTTAEAVADIFASKAAANLAANPAAHQGLSEPAAKPVATEDTQVTGVYQTLLKDYFLGLFLQRQSKNYPGHFQHFVLAGQVTLVVGILLLFIWICSDATGLLGRRKPPGQAAVEQWIATKHGPHEILSVAPGPEETDLVVKFRYRSPGGKQIETQRVFRIDDGNVSLVVTD